MTIERAARSLQPLTGIPCSPSEYRDQFCSDVGKVRYNASIVLDLALQNGRRGRRLALSADRVIKAAGVQSRVLGHRELRNLKSKYKVMQKEAEKFGRSLDPKWGLVLGLLLGII